MNKREFMQIIDKYYFNYDLREIRITIWTGQTSLENRDSSRRQDNK